MCHTYRKWLFGFTWPVQFTINGLPSIIVPAVYPAVSLGLLVPLGQRQGIHLDRLIVRAHTPLTLTLTYRFSLQST